MSAESNKHLMHRFMELMNTGDAALAAELISPSAMFAIPRSVPVLGPAGYLRALAMLRGGFPDMRWALEDVVVEETRVAARFMVRGTHRGTFLGMAATGKTIDLKGLGFYRLLGGQILEEYVQPDLAMYLRLIKAAADRPRTRGGEAQPICRNRSSLAFRYSAQS